MSDRPARWIVGLALLACTVPGEAAAAPTGPTVLREIPYPGGATVERRRSLDLYQPSDRRGKPPLLIFVHGGHHVTAMTGSAHGGLALSLESYPPEVWKTFLFDQETVARKMGVRPNPVDGTVRQSLHDLVSESRRAPGPKR